MMPTSAGARELSKWHFKLNWSVSFLTYRVYYCILDGAEVNRQFIKLHFTDEHDAIARKFVGHNIYTGKPMVFLMDPKVSCKTGFAIIWPKIDQYMIIATLQEYNIEFIELLG